MHANNRRLCIPRSLGVFYLVMLSFFLLPSSTHATVVKALSLQQILQGAELVFEGRVLNVTSHIEPGQRMAHTYVTFKILDILKGHHPDETLQLRFLGGRRGNRVYAVTDMHVPRLGERGIYFVESKDNGQAHPLVGWSQGHLLVVHDIDGLARMATHDGQPISQLQSAPQRARSYSHGIARGLQLLSRQQSLGDGLTVSAFKQQLKKLQAAP